MKKRHHKYSKISLEYFQACYVVPEEWKQICSIFNEEYRLLANDCNLQLRLKLDNKTIWSSCNIDTLLEMYLTPGKYYPFTCDDCGDPGCAGIFAPSRIIHSGEDIILCLRSPLQENNDPRWSTRWRYRAYRLRKKDYLRELLSVMHFRISLENTLNIKFNETQDEEKQRQDLCLLMDIFGLESCVMYHKDISENIRTAFPKLKNEFLKMLGKEIL